MKHLNRDIIRRGITVLFITVFIVLIILLIVYTKIINGVGVICPFYESFGISCPGCGATRMCEELLKGNIYQAFRYNPFIFVTAPIVGIVYLYQAYIFIKENKLLVWLDKFLVTYAIFLVAFGVLRNISYFRWLEPTLLN